MDLLKAEDLLTDLMTRHGLKAIDNHWEHGWDKAKSRWGCCHYSDKKITLSKEFTLLNDEEIVKDVMLHEIAHALAPAGAHHGLQWKRKAIELGCKPEANNGNVIKPKSKYTGTCSNCGYTIQCMKITRGSCGQCSRVFDPSKRFTYTLN